MQLHLKSTRLKIIPDLLSRFHLLEQPPLLWPAPIRRINAVALPAALATSADTLILRRCCTNFKKRAKPSETPPAGEPRAAAAANAAVFPTESEALWQWGVLSYRLLLLRITQPRANGSQGNMSPTTHEKVEKRLTTTTSTSSPHCVQAIRRRKHLSSSSPVPRPLGRGRTA